MRAWAWWMAPLLAADAAWSFCDGISAIRFTAATTGRSTRPARRARNASDLWPGVVIQALVEHHRASGDSASLTEARSLFAEIDRHARDRRHGGGIEHFERNWTPLPLCLPDGAPEVAKLKSANTHLHLMEAFTELYAATGDPAVQAALEETWRLNQEVFYPADPASACFHRYPD